MRWEIQDHGSNVVVVVVEGHEVVDDGKDDKDACIMDPVAKAVVVQGHSVTWHM